MLLYKLSIKLFKSDLEISKKIIDTVSKKTSALIKSNIRYKNRNFSIIAHTVTVNQRLQIV